ncbi:MAG: hypothetical protein GWN71_09325 [Gammaproteobacteria bacterium]|nr:hypothetical protein [Gammaproteobacteria bacterium]
MRGDMVELSHGADTFLRDMGLRYSAGRLLGSASFVFAGEGVDVVLTKQ